MKATICDYCKEPIGDPADVNTISVNGCGHDMCETCFHSSVILAESRRVRTRKVRKSRKRVKVVDLGDPIVSAPLEAGPVVTDFQGNSTVIVDTDWMDPAKAKFAEIKARQ